MAYRSEANRIGNKANYTDLNLTHYPNNLDTRANNQNMKGFVNVGESDIPDYVMAEYVNAALDGIMAIQRSLGKTPHVPSYTAPANVPSVIESGSVGNRLTLIENGLFDERYGGTGWPGSNFSARPTLSKHNHNGAGGHPNKIVLTTEVQGLLPRTNINLTASVGLTGANILTSSTNTNTIEASLNDMLSKSTGGIVNGFTQFKKGTRTNTIIECSAEQFSGLSAATLVSDTSATSGRVVRGSGTAVATFHRETLTQDLFFGRYVISMRVKASNINNRTNLLRITVGSQNFYFRGNEFTAANQFQNVYFVFEHNTANAPLTISKVATTGVVDVSIDNFYIHPIYPAVFDR